MADHITDKAVTAAACDEFRRTWSARLDTLLSRADLLDADDQLAVLTVHETLLAEQFAALPVLNTTQPGRPRLFGDIPITERTPHGVWIADGPDPDRDPTGPDCGGLATCRECTAYDALRQHLVEQIMLLDQQRQDETAALRDALDSIRALVTKYHDRDDVLPADLVDQVYALTAAASLRGEQ